MPVYFIQIGEAGPVKIGWAGNPAKRRASLQTSHYEALRIIRVSSDDRRHETWFHKRFCSSRINREWFRFQPEMMTAAPPPLPPKRPRPDIRRLVNRGIMQSFTEIINAWPHPSKLAEDVGVTPALVAVWKSRDTIPAAYWNWVVDAAEKRGIQGVSFDVLGRLIRAKRSTPDDPQPPEAA